MKRLITIVLAITMLLALAACAPTPQTDNPPSSSDVKPINIAVLKGPTGMGAAWLMEQNALGLSENEYNFTVAGAPDLAVSQLVTGELDIAAIPTNTASVLYNKTGGGVKVLAVNTLGVLYILENGGSVSSVDDLRGKRIVSAGQGTTAEYVVSYVLEQNGLKPGVDVEIVYVSEHSEAAALALSGDYELIIVPEPFVSSIQAKDIGFHICVDLTEEWENTGAGQLTMGAIVATSAFVNEHPEQVESFLREYALSIEYTTSDVSAAAALVEKYDILAAAVAEKAIPNSNIVFMNGEEMKAELEAFYGILYDYSAQSVGGSLPDEDIYYISLS